VAQSVDAGAAIMLALVSRTHAADLVATPGEQATARSSPRPRRLALPQPSFGRAAFGRVYQRYRPRSGSRILSSRSPGFDKIPGSLPVALRDGEAHDVFAIYTVFRARATNA
jgi:hypothetical protein